jgi:predicted dehydrogenase
LKSKARVGIVGAGQTVGIAHYHALGILADGRAEISAVYDLDAESAARFVKEHALDNTRVCANYRQLLECVDAVDICTPNFTHIDYVLGAIEAEKAVFVEKPLALSANDSRRAVQALEGKSLFNMVGFVYRYTHLVQELRRLVSSDMGRVYTFSASLGGRRLSNMNIPLEWRMVKKYSGHGALADFGSHLVDLADYIAGMSLETVSGLTATVIPERQANAEGLTRVENDDQAVFTARTADNALASFTVSRVGMDDLMIFIAGEGGLARASLANPEVIQYLPAHHGIYAQNPTEIRVAPQKFFEDWFVAQMRAFVDGLTGREVKVANIRQGHYVECVLDAVKKASLVQVERVAL